MKIFSKIRINLSTFYNCFTYCFLFFSEKLLDTARAIKFQAFLFVCTTFLLNLFFPRWLKVWIFSSPCNPIAGQISVYQIIRISHKFWTLKSYSPKPISIPNNTAWYLIINNKCDIKIGIGLKINALCSLKLYTNIIG